MMKSRYRLLFLSLLALLSQSGCQSLRPLTPAPNAAPEIQIFSPKPVSIEEGVASWYGGKWIGRLTANGERYRANDFTAAHKKLPFNTRVRVIHLKTGKSIIVRINNRGPFVKGRIIDLSVEAAKALGTYEIGLAKVRLEVLRPIPIMTSPNLKTKTTKPAGSPSSSSIQSAAPKSKSNPLPTATPPDPASTDSPKAKRKKIPNSPCPDSSPSVSSKRKSEPLKKETSPLSRDDSPKPKSESRNSKSIPDPTPQSSPTKARDSKPTQNEVGKP